MTVAESRGPRGGHRRTGGDLRRRHRGDRHPRAGGGRRPVHDRCRRRPTSVIVLMMVVASVTLLPAFLGLAGHRDQPASASIGVARGGGTTGRPAGSDGAARVRACMDYAVGVTVLLVALTAPSLTLRLGFPDEGTLPESAPSAAPTTWWRTVSDPGSTARWSSPSTSPRRRRRCAHSAARARRGGGPERASSRCHRR